MQGNFFKALSLGKWSIFRGNSVRFIPGFKEIGNTPGFMVGGVTDGISARSCDHRSRPTSCIAYSCLRMLRDKVQFDVLVCTNVLRYGCHCF